MQIKALRTTLLAAFLAVPVAHAQGIRGGMGEALQRIGSQMQEYGAQSDLMEQQHRQEMERMQLQQQLEMERQRQRQQQLQTQQQQAEQDRQKQTAQVERTMEAAHPGWRQTVRSPAFDQWIARQPSSVQGLAASERPADAILLLDLFKRDIAAK